MSDIKMTIQVRLSLVGEGMRRSRKAWGRCFWAHTGMKRSSCECIDLGKKQASRWRRGKHKVQWQEQASWVWGTERPVQLEHNEQGKVWSDMRLKTWSRVEAGGAFWTTRPRPDLTFCHQPAVLTLTVTSPGHSQALDLPQLPWFYQVWLVLEVF